MAENQDRSVRTPWFGLFARQLLGRTSLHVLVALLAGIALFSVIEFVEAGNQASASASPWDLTKLVLLSTPLMFQEICGVMVLIGAATGISGFFRRQEMGAMMAAGAGPTMLLKAGVVLGIVCALVYGAVTEWVVPHARAQVASLKRTVGLGHRIRGEKQQKWFRGQDRIFRVEALGDPGAHTLLGVLILHTQGGRIRDRWELDRMVYEDQSWRASGLTHIHFEDEALKTTRSTTEVFSLPEVPSDFLHSVGIPGHLSFRTLYRSTLARERLGQPSTLHRLELYRRLTLPITLALAVALVAGLLFLLPFHPTTAQAMGIGATLGFFVWILDELARALGSTSALPPWAAGQVGLAAIAVSAGWTWFRTLRNDANSS